ncbi:unnamed protein product [Victoria cruziana]
MVVCKCRKATKLYCFVHKVPVCGECVCFPEHQICVVRAYSEWVIDGEYDWPPTCCMCQAVLDDASDCQTTRLGCFHVIHSSCLVSHIQKFPLNTAPAGYTCPACSSPLWPPKNIKDSASRVHLKLKESIIQSGLEKNILGDQVVLPKPEPRDPPPAFSSGPLVGISPDVKDIGLISSNLKEEGLSGGYPLDSGTARLSVEDIIEINGPTSMGNQFTSSQESRFSKSLSPVGPGATTRKSTGYTVDRQNSEVSYYADDEDGTRKKYSRRGPFRHKFLRLLLPFWSSALPTLPVTAPPRKDREGATDDINEGRSRHPKSSRMDPRKILLFLAIMACMATMVILYYRIAQRNLLEAVPEDGQE